MRVDKWLWTARLFKTRALAAGAVNGGRVHVNGVAVKPSREVGPGDELEITIGTVRRTVIVRGAAERRVSAAEAANLYEETEESVAQRERQAPARRAGRSRRAPDQARSPSLRRWPALAIRAWRCRRTCAAISEAADKVNKSPRVPVPGLARRVPLGGDRVRDRRVRRERHERGQRREDDRPDPADPAHRAPFRPSVDHSRVRLQAA
jgi:ribosome-associated heat shock protein Hsp15